MDGLRKDRMPILDTDVIIDYINGEDKVKDIIDKRSSEGQIYTTIINQYELLKGTESDDEDTAVGGILANLTVQPLDSASVTESSLIFKRLKKKGNIIPEQDILIAGVAISRNDILITRDRHFKEISGLKLTLI